MPRSDGQWAVRASELRHCDYRLRSLAGSVRRYRDRPIAPMGGPYGRFVSAISAIRRHGTPKVGSDAAPGALLWWHLRATVKRWSVAGG